MKRYRVAAAAAIAAAAGVGFAHVSAPASPTAVEHVAPSAPPRATPAGWTSSFGHIASLVRRGDRFEMRFDPAWFLRGVTAERAAVADGAIAPGEPVPNDDYIVEEGHRLLTYVVPPATPVTVLTRHGSGAVPRTRISVAELSAIAAGRNPRHRALTEPAAGFWIAVGSRYPNPVRSIDQQYQP